MREPEVLIIGAGAAGLCAARTLARAGTPSLILEARQRLGGRIQTVYDSLSPVPVELGAEFVHGMPREVWEAVGGSGLAAQELDARHVRVNGRVEPDDAISEQVDGVMAAMAAAPEQPFREFVDASGASPEVRRRAVDYVEGFNAARSELISVRSLARQDEASAKIEGDRLFRLQPGYGALIDWLWTGMGAGLARVRFGAVVEAVRWRARHVEISARVFGRAMKFYAPRAIVTVPLGVLQAPAGAEGAIRFDPEPPTLAAARAAIAMGHASRITLRFREPIWERRGEFQGAGFLHTSEPWMPTWWTSLPVRAPVITGWMAGPAAECAASEEPAAWLGHALRSLARTLRTDETTLAGELEAWHAHNWSGDPFARGAYSYVRTGGVEAQRNWSEPVEDTLYFAGEAVNGEGHAATVHGAMATGERAAERILRRCGGVT
jgi:monoamine oxidase